MKESDSSSSAQLEVKIDDKPYGVSDIVVSRNDHFFAIFTFCMIGTVQLLIWNVVITSFSTLQTYIWPGYVFSDLLGGAEHAAALLVSIVMFKFNALNQRLCHICGIANVILYLIFPLVPQFLRAEVQGKSNGQFEIVNGNSHIQAAQAWLSVVSVFLGACSGLLHVFGYAFASITPANYCGYVSTGNGIAGVLPFVTFTILFASFKRTQVAQLNLTWTFFSLGALCSLVQVISFYYLCQKEWFNQCIELAQKRQDESAEGILNEWGERRSMLEVFKDCWLQAFNASFTLFVTLLLFPVTGPFNWPLNRPEMFNYLIGTFQVIDLILRWMPALGGWTQLPKKWLNILVLIRPLVFIPLFVLPAKIRPLKFLGDTWWLFINMTFFTITNGWFVTLGSLYCPDCVSHPAEKELASKILVVGLLSFITAGVFASRLPTL